MPGRSDARSCTRSEPKLTTPGAVPDSVTGNLLGKPVGPGDH